MNLNGQTIILTGAASGIGRALLSLLAGYRCQILACDAAEFEPPDISNSQAEIHTFQGDLGQPETVDALFETALAWMGGIGLFIANAGFAYYEHLAHADWGRIERLYRVNVVSPLYCAVKMGEINAGRPYRVVMTSSAMAYLPLAGYALYAGSKSALHHFAEAYRYELPDPQAVTLVYPIATRSNFFQAASDSTAAPLPWPNQTPDYVAWAILRGLERDQRAIYPSYQFRAYRLLSRILPLGRLIQAEANRQFKTWLRHTHSR